MPYIAQPYSNAQRTARMSDLMRAEAAANADAQYARAAASAQMWNGIGQAVGGGLQQIGQQQLQQERDAPKRELQDLQLREAKTDVENRRKITDVLKLTRNPDTGEIDMRQAAREIGSFAPEEAQKFLGAAKEQDKFALLENKGRLERLGQLAGAALIDAEHVPPPQRPALFQAFAQRAVEQGLVKPEDIPQNLSESFVRQTFLSSLSASDLADQVQALSKPRDGFTLSEGQQRFDADGNPIASVAKAPTAPKAGSLDGFIEMLQHEKGTPLTQQEVLQARAKWEAAGRAPERGGSDNEPLVAIIGEDGQSILVPRREAIGKRPASNREQGRPVTSGDAGRVTDIDAALSDLGTLNTTLRSTDGATGPWAATAASLPNAITATIGWGADAKSRQATIDRVKQVIGKTLEGGVLRKEDEEKYAKILPTISDSPEVAASKLEDLDTAIRDRRSMTLENLAAAGFDTSKFGGGAGIVVRTPDGREYSFPTLRAANAFKSKAGIK